MLHQPEKENPSSPKPRTYGQELHTAASLGEEDGTHTRRRTPTPIAATRRRSCARRPSPSPERPRAEFDGEKTKRQWAQCEGEKQGRRRGITGFPDRWAPPISNQTRRPPARTSTSVENRRHAGRHVPNTSHQNS